MTQKEYEIALKQFLDNGGVIQKLPFYSPNYVGILTKQQIKF